jgi:hypothetical protein
MRYGQSLALSAYKLGDAIPALKVPLSHSETGESGIQGGGCRARGDLGGNPIEDSKGRIAKPDSHPIVTRCSRFQFLSFLFFFFTKIEAPRGDGSCSR